MNIVLCLILIASSGFHLTSSACSWYLLAIHCTDDPPPKVTCQWGSWELAAECSRSCGGGTRTKIRSKTRTEVNTACGGPATKIEQCNTAKCQEPKVYCQWSAWFGGGCSKACGGGIQTMIRQKNQIEIGTTCNGDNVKQVSCNTEKCPETKVYCQWDSWTIFECSKSCGGGKRVKTRSKLVTEVGTLCKGLATIQEDCNSAKCEDRSVQCVWGTWFDGGCSRTCGGGTKNLFRTKAQIEVGTTCKGENVKQIKCNTEECPDSNWMIYSGLGGFLLLILLIFVAYYIYWRNVTYQYWHIYENDEEMSEIPRSVGFSEIATGNVLLPHGKEFEKLEKHGEKDGSKSKMSEGQKNNKIGLNRHPDVLPFDEYRVKLRTPINGCDYVNANWLGKIRDEDYYDEAANTTTRVEVNEEYNAYYEEDPTVEPIDKASNVNVTFILGEDPTTNARPHYYQMLLENFVSVVVQIKDQEETKAPKIGKDRHFGHMTRNIQSREKVNSNLYKTEMYIVNTNTNKNFRHLLTSFELIRQPLSGNTNDFLTAMSIVRNCFKDVDGSVKAMVHDEDGGIGGASVFVVLHDLLQRVDEIFEKGKQASLSDDEGPKLDVFKIVNGFRTYRPQMINNFGDYKFLFMCLGNYGGNKASFDLIRSRKKAKSTRKSVRFSIFSSSEKNDDNEQPQKDRQKTPRRSSRFCIFSNSKKNGLQEELMKTIQNRSNAYTPSPDVVINVSGQEEEDIEDEWFEDVGSEYEFDDVPKK